MIIYIVYDHRNTRPGILINTNTAFKIISTMNKHNLLVDINSFLSQLQKRNFCHSLHCVFDEYAENRTIKITRKCLLHLDDKMNAR